jgi:hypothetical protein
MAYTQVSDVVVPSVFSAYLATMTEQKSAFVQSGVLVRDSEADAKVAGGGLTFSMPRWNDLGDDAANISLGASGSPTTPINIAAHTEVGVRLSRNQSWGSADLVSRLAGADPMQAIAARIQPYWTRRMQAALLASAKGVFADNTANDSGDYTHDIKGGGFVDGVTNFSAEEVIKALHTAGDSELDLVAISMHSVVYMRAKTLNLIDFRSDSGNDDAAGFGRFLGRTVIVDDGMPNDTGVYETFLFGAGAFSLGVGTPGVPLESYRLPLDAAGGGTEAIVSRVEWCIHPRGHAYIGSPGNGGPSDLATANNLGAAGSWNRVAPERKQVKLARLITREA